MERQILKLRPLKLNKKGQLGLDTVRTVMISFLTLAVIAIAVVLALVSLRDSNIFTSGSQEETDVNNTIRNVTSALTDFFDDTGTIFAILVVVVIILAISIIIAVVSRFGGAAGGGISLGRGEKGEETVMGI